jgi:hypothetical protein
MHTSIFIGRDSVNASSYEHLKDPLEITIASSVSDDAVVSLPTEDVDKFNARVYQKITVGQLREVLEQREADRVADVEQAQREAEVLEAKEPAADGH